MRALLRTSCLFLVSLVISFLMAEATFRVYALGWEAFSYEATKSVVKLGHSSLVRRTEDPGVAWELVPDQQMLFKMAEVRTNSAGLHDEEYPRRKPPNTFRVAVLGDSQTMASGVALEDAYHSVLE